MESLKLDRNINYGSVLPIVVFISGLLIIYFFSSKLYAEGVITMLFSSIFYIIMILIRSTDVRPPTQFNLILENISTFMTFGISTIMFGIIFYSPNVEILFILFIYFFAIACVLSIARNWEYDIRHALGMPLAFNGVFFPLFYYMYRFFFNDTGDSIFLIYYLIAGILTISSFKFLWFDEKLIKDKNKYKNYYSNLEDQDKVVEQRIINRDNKHFENKEEDKDKIKNNYKHKNNQLEDSIIDKFQNRILKIISKKDNFNEIKGMPTKSELDKILPHTYQKQKLKKKRERLFTKLIRLLVFKNKTAVNIYNTTEDIPSKKELEETLSDTNNAKQKVIDELSSKSKPKKKERLFTKIIKYLSKTKVKKILTVGNDKLEDMPTKEDVARVLPHILEQKRILKKEKKRERILTKIIKLFRKDNNIQKEISNQPKKELKPEVNKNQLKPEIIEKNNKNQDNTNDFDLVGGSNNINTIQRKEIEEVFIPSQDSTNNNKSNTYNKNTIQRKEIEEVFIPSQDNTNNDKSNGNIGTIQRKEIEEVFTPSQDSTNNNKSNTYNKNTIQRKEIEEVFTPSQNNTDNNNNIDTDNKSSNDEFDLEEFEDDYNHQIEYKKQEKKQLVKESTPIKKETTLDKSNNEEYDLDDFEDDYQK